jgi:hypothetical protein
MTAFIDHQLGKLTWDKLLFLVGFGALLLSPSNNLLIPLGLFFMVTGISIGLYKWNREIADNTSDEDEKDYREGILISIFFMYILAITAIIVGYLIYLKVINFL